MTERVAPERWATTNQGPEPAAGETPGAEDQVGEEAPPGLAGPPGDRGWTAWLPPWAERIIDPIAILTLGAAFLYFLGAISYYAFFRSLGLPDEEIVLSVPSYMTRGALTSPVPLAVLSLLAYEAVRRPASRLLTGVANGVAAALLVFLVSVVVWVTPEALFFGVLPAKPRLLSVLWLLVAALVAALAIVASITGRSLVRNLVGDRLGKAYAVGAALVIVLVVANLSGALAAESLRRGDAGKVVIITR